MSGIVIQPPARLQYPIEEGAELLGISKHTLIRDIRRGAIRTCRYGKRVLIPRDEILRIAADGMASEAKPAA
jgi:excisionase family DNA binding protein